MLAIRSQDRERERPEEEIRRVQRETSSLRQTTRGTEQRPEKLRRRHQRNGTLQIRPRKRTRGTRVRRDQLELHAAETEGRKERVGHAQRPAGEGETVHRPRLHPGCLQHGVGRHLLRAPAAGADAHLQPQTQLARHQDQRQVQFDQVQRRREPDRGLERPRPA